MEVKGENEMRRVLELKKSALKVQKAIEERGMNFKVVQLDSSTRTAEDAANSIGCSTIDIVKSLLFRTKKSKRPILVLASGQNRVNTKAVKNVVGENISKPDAKYVREVTGYAIGGIPPVGHAQKLSTYIDEDLLKNKEGVIKNHTIWAAAGTPNAVFSMDSDQLASLTDGQVISIK